MGKPTEVILLCEDYRQSSLILRFLRLCGIHHRGIRPLLSPKGSGSAEHWVVQQYPIQVDAYRLAKARKRAWLIVLLDADNHTISQRIAQLDAGLTQATDIRLREMNIAEEAIGRLIARRNIETWILALTDVSANETEDYKSRKSPEEWAALVTSASVKLYEWTRPNTELSKSMIESLRRGIHELTHLEQVGR